MSDLAQRFAATAEEVGSQRGAPTVVTDDPAWTGGPTMADDGVHPSGAGYEVLAQLFLTRHRASALILRNSQEERSSRPLDFCFSCLS